MPMGSGYAGQAASLSPAQNGYQNQSVQLKPAAGGSPEVQLKPVQAKTAEERAREAQQANTSTPLPGGATIGGGTSQLTINGVEVTINADAVDDTQATAGATRAPVTWSGAQWRTLNGRVTSFVPPSIQMTISTSYVDQNTMDNAGSLPSGYGRGTTDDDRDAGNTSLRFHEGEHGQDFLDYLTNNPLPVFTGAVGMSTSEFSALDASYRAALATYFRPITSFTVEETDCVGELPAEGTELRAQCDAADDDGLGH
jgi:hypothetical protein